MAPNQSSSLSSDLSSDLSKDERVDVLVIGAGLIGSSVAMNLAKLGVKNIRVIDFDLEGALSSSELNAGGVRATWYHPLNIQTSQLSIQYFSEHAADVGYRPCGYLWLHGAEKLPRALKARDLQQKMGWEVQAWDIPELRRKVPFIDKTQGIAGALFAPRDGLVNPNLLKNHYRDEAKTLGVQFDDRTVVCQAEWEGGKYRVRCDRYRPSVAFEAKLRVYQGKKFGHIASESVVYEAGTVINCAGPWAPDVAKILGYDCPSHPVRRQVCIFDTRDVDLTPYGMIVDPSGVYFHPEATNGLAGFANVDEAPGINYTYDGESFFNEHIWPALYERSTGFEKLKHITGWAGLYEVSPDESAMIGRVEEGEAGRSGCVYEAHSFSGHGAMHSYAAGLALAERIVTGRYQTIDLGPLSGGRFSRGESVRETLVI